MTSLNVVLRYVCTSEMDPLSEERNMYNQLSLEGFLNMGTVKIGVLNTRDFIFHGRKRSMAVG